MPESDGSRERCQREHDDAAIESFQAEVEVDGPENEGCRQDENSHGVHREFAWPARRSGLVALKIGCRSQDRDTERACQCGAKRDECGRTYRQRHAATSSVTSHQLLELRADVPESAMKIRQLEVVCEVPVKRHRGEPGHTRDHARDTPGRAHGRTRAHGSSTGKVQ